MTEQRRKPNSGDIISKSPKYLTLKNKAIFAAAVRENAFQYSTSENKAVKVI